MGIIDKWEPASKGVLPDEQFPFKKFYFSTEPIDTLSLRSLTSEDYPVMYWAPRREDIERTVLTAETLHGSRPGKPVVLEIGAGSGLLSYLLALTDRVEVIAADPDPTLAERTSYRHENMAFIVADSDATSRMFRQRYVTLAISSWMPSGLNFTPAIRDIEADGILYVLDARGNTGVQLENIVRARYGNSVNLDDYISYRPGDRYYRALSWRGPAHWELCSHFKGFDPTTLIDSNVIEIQFSKDVKAEKARKLAAAFSRIDPASFRQYPWEEELCAWKGSRSGAVKLMV